MFSWKALMPAVAASLVSLIAAAFVISAAFDHFVSSRTDQALDRQVDELLAGATTRNGEVIAPALTDPAALRAYSGHYWQIAASTGKGADVQVKSRSLFDYTLRLPSNLGSAHAKYYNSQGPAGQRLRVAVRETMLPGIASPMLFIVATDRNPAEQGKGGFLMTTLIMLAFATAATGVSVWLVTRRASANSAFVRDRLQLSPSRL